MRHLIPAVGCLALAGSFTLEAAPPGRTLEFKKSATIDVPAPTAEIVQYVEVDGRRLVLTTNAMWDTLDLFHVGSFDPLKVEPLSDMDDLKPGIQGIAMLGTPTSVAVHPAQPIALVAQLGHTLMDRGYVAGYDLRDGKGFGGMTVFQKVGMHPDSIAISPDGRWALLACEGEGHPETPGSIWAVDLRGLTPDQAPKDGELPAFELEGLDDLLRKPAGVIEPEYAAFDPRSRFAVVTLQEDNGFVIVDMANTRPRLTTFTALSIQAAPDGAAVLEDVSGPDGRPGCLIGVTEEGAYDTYLQKWWGQSLSFHWVDPHMLDAPPVLLSRLDLRSLIAPDEPDERYDPEGIRLVRFAGKQLALVVVERGDLLLCLDLDDPTRPKLLDKIRVGDRPESLIALPPGSDPENPGDLIIITADEGNEGPGEISFVRLTAPTRTQAAK